ncbi:MAG TPA: NAD(P)/FAD-dependent oxidoreductase [Pyrinomonadaceae bacterium]|jgi:flavin-dependent dehydrogenase|nr:NAD(P)/FAD-dependent oxidoreductase [Pyrinomonadaceae bacterium]
MEHYDVIIIGAGLAGLHCARLLGKRGLTVLLADRKESLHTSIHTTGIFVRRTLEDFDIPEDCLGPVIRDVTLYSPSRSRMNLASPHDEFRVGKMGQLYTRYLDHCLRVGVTWMPGTRYAEHRRTGKALAVRLDNSGGKPHWVTTRYLVGADGANSRVARDLGLELNREWIVGVEDVYTNVPLAGPPRLHCFLDPAIAPGYLAWVANDGEDTHIGVGGYAAMFEPVLALEKFKSSLQGIADLSNATQIERRGGRIPVGGVLRDIACQQGLLIGDAAGAVSPLTAGGLDPCMRLSTLAASVIEEYLTTGSAEALAAYSGELFRARFASRIWMRRLVSIIRQPALLDLACASLRLPILNSFAWHVFFGRGSFPDVNVKSNPDTVCEAKGAGP